MVTGGLGRTDIGNTNVIGGLALELFTRNAAYYGQSTPEWFFEPHVAEKILLEMLSEAGVDVIYNQTIKSAATSGTTITSITMFEGPAYEASQFSDASYEGDLFAAAGASFAVGREASTVYNESQAGRNLYSEGNQIQFRVNPFADDGSVLPLLNLGDIGPPGTGDKQVQAYNFRLCVTQNTSNFVAFPEPDNYDPARWELFRRYAAVLNATDKPAVLTTFLGNTRSTVGSKFDMNNGGPTSTDCIGCSWTWPEASWPERYGVWHHHKQYHLELMKFLREDPVLSAAVHSDAASWGLCADEYLDSGYWPEQLYVREGRRLVGDKVFTQNTAQTEHEQPDGIGCGSYNFDSHHSQRMLCKPDTEHCEPPSAAPPAGTNVTGWYFVDEGNVQVNPGEYQIPYWVMLPKRAEATNMLVPISASSSHIGYCTLRLEPQYMIMGHAAGVATALAIESSIAVQDVNTTAMQAVLKAQNAIIDLPKA
jgi:hypothetical protein